MQLEFINIAALLLGAIVVIALEKTKWIQTVAIVELIISLFLTLIIGDFLRLPIANVDGVLSFLTLVGWVPVLVFSKNKSTLISAAILAWISATRVLIEIGWIRIDAIGALL